MSEGEKIEIEPILLNNAFSMYTIWEYWNIFAKQRLDIVNKSLRISSHFDTENYTWRLDIVWSFFLVWFFFGNLSQNIYFKTFKTI